MVSGVLLAAGLELLILADLARARLRGVPHRFFSRPALFVHALFAALVCCFLYGRYIEPYRLQVTRVEIYTPKLKRAALRVVQISDLHCDLTARLEDRLPGVINALDPDLVVFTGDALNDIRALPLFQDTLKRMHARIAKLAAPGNYDSTLWRGVPLYGGTGFTQLDGKPLRFAKEGEEFWVTGGGLSRLNLAAAFSGVPAQAYAVFLFHLPDLAEDFRVRRPDLYLAGHTHGGQIALPFYGAVITLARHGKKYEAGRYDLGDMTLYVNRGIGMEGGSAPRLRFLARPEVTVFDIRPAAVEARGGGGR